MSNIKSNQAQAEESNSSKLSNNHMYSDDKNSDNVSPKRTRG
jgi:hypothetical protein